MFRSRLVGPLAVAFLLVGVAGPALALPAAGPKAGDQTPATAAPAPAQPGTMFGKEVTLPERSIIYLKGEAKWDSAFDTLLQGFKTLHAYLDKEGIKPSGPAMTIYTETSDTGFRFEAAYPIAQAPANPPKGDIAVAKAPSGKALEFEHRGSYDAMDSTYEAITNYLDERQIDAQDMFIEEYAVDPTTADPDKLVVHIFVPTK